MKWNKYTIETTTAAEDYLSSALMDLGIEGVQIEDNVPLTKEDQAEMFIDFLPELPPDEGISYVSFYLEDNGQDDTELLKQVKTTIEEMRNVVDMGTGKITSDQTEDLDWINNWKKFFSSFYIEDILIKPTWEELKEESNRNIQSEKGILNRQIRSIQTEGHFGDIKENENFRRFHYRSAEKVYKEFMLYAIGRNINKYHRFLHGEIQKYEGKKDPKTA